MKKAVVIIYNHPELYPPTLNAIHEIAREIEQVEVIHRPNCTTRWQYPENVQLTHWENEEPKPAEFSSRAKVLQFYAFTKKIRRQLKDKPEIIVIYDFMALYAYYLANKGVNFKGKCWYHNHDVPAYEALRKFSVGWFARNIHEKIFGQLDLFSLPSAERIKYFPVHLLRTKPAIIPNYPSKRRIKTLISNDQAKEAQKLKIIYQGEVARGHGIEEILNILGSDINGKKIEIHVFGKGDQAFVDELKTKVESEGIGDYFNFHGFVPYATLFGYTANADIGLALTPDNVNYNSAGQASNKIYEYAACGLPILYSDHEHYVKYLGELTWAFPSTGTADNLKLQLKRIDSDYEAIAMAAQQDFQEKFNFESHFSTVLKSMLDNNHQKE